MKLIHTYRFLAAATLLAIVRTVPAAEDTAAGAAPAKNLPSVREMIDARTDVWGDTAMQQPDGASYEFFKDLLPPVRWVNTEFRHYPIVLSAPRAEQKVRLPSNGSAVNPRAGKPPMWREQGTPVTFFVGNAAEGFGAELTGLKTPEYLNGYLPVVAIEYEHDGTTYRQESFAPVDAGLAASGTVFLRFTANGPGEGRIEAQIGGESPLRFEQGQVFDKQGCVAAFSQPGWTWNDERRSLVAQLKPGSAAVLAVYTLPRASAAFSSRDYDDHRQKTIDAWKKILDRGTQLETPEKIVNDAWRSMIVGTLMLAVGDRLHYSAQNGYAKLYEGECGDTLRSLLVFGHNQDGPAMLKPLLEFNREATKYHVAGHKLQLLAYYYRLTGDADSIRAFEPIWRPALDMILSSREPDSGLLPKDNYAGDIDTKVYALNSNANCWRGLRDVAAMLEDMGQPDEARQINKEAAEYRRKILAAVAKSERRDAKPPFIPNALLADEPAHDPLTATRTGSYYDLMAPYIIGSEIFGQGSDREDWLIGYLQNHGGIGMGMPRTMPHQGQFNQEPGTVPLYALRYQMTLLRRDEREKALVGFYGHLAQGTTRGTFIGGEGNRFLHGDANGRSFYLPPNSTSSATWLVTLRNLLVQDWDLDEDARADTLRLMFAAPRRWLADGQQIKLENAPTQFGPVALQAHSKLSDGAVEIRVTPPPRRPKSMLLRAPLPAGWQIESAEIDGQPAKLVGGDTLELTGREAPIVAKFNVRRTGEQ
jgi:hypothetical protein